jgi:hypothetical protein
MERKINEINVLLFLEKQLNYSSEILKGEGINEKNTDRSDHSFIGIGFFSG